ncbi:hypothetical protein SAMN04487905_109148 [Actinopolyspora xinjiangensis]|uniref:Uncharacterized protein n=1 Tax=Actinopolyspora xinjiangensis TaxID=405564 RepID=A0A1H0VPN3_9ACTN|nr:hypothetical protein SAMN04487905_109148 [Actinopolyspora xinjiangensis]
MCLVPSGPSCPSRSRSRRTARVPKRLPYDVGTFEIADTTVGARDAPGRERPDAVGISASIRRNDSAPALRRVGTATRMPELGPPSGPDSASRRWQ